MIKETLAGYLLFAGQLPFSRSSAAAEVTPRKRRLLREADKSLSVCPGLRQKEILKVVQDMWLSKLKGIPHATSRHSWKTRDLEYLARSPQQHLYPQKLGKPQKQVPGSECASSYGEVS